MVGDPANVTNEFRTLLTALLGTLEDELADRSQSSVRRDRMKGMYRNSLRLMQLVNALFEVARPESPRARTGNTPVDLAAETVVIPRLRDDATLEISPREQVRVRESVREPRASATGSGQLERLSQEVEAFSYSVAHDLRVPLQTVDGLSQVLATNYGHALDDNGRELLTQIHCGTQRMTAIIDDLLALCQVGRGELRREMVDVTAIARRIVADLRLREPSREVEVSVPEGMAASGDGRLVAIALENLLANAWKFTSKRPRAQIAIEREAGGVFVVRDNGAGFDMRNSSQLFEPFQRLHASSEFEGTGIGLAIVRRVVERHGGRVWAQGAVEHGATVRFTLEPNPTAS